MNLSFGKYKNKSIKHIFENDRQYLKWLATQPWFIIKYKDLYSNYLSLLRDEIKNDTSDNQLIIYTDGACSHNGNKEKAKAGIGVYFSESNTEKYENISQKLEIREPTNNKAELIAILESLRSTQNSKLPITIYTDSQYSINAITLCYPEWIKTDKLHTKKNTDILTKIHLQLVSRDVYFKHIKGHSKQTDIHSLGNEKADYLATSCL
jgi:ribonuclease HI